MNCPKCNITLTMSERQGVEIDYCPQCRGIWLDRGELDKILERSAGQNFSAGNQQMGQSHDQGYYGHKQKHYHKKSWLHELFD